MNDIIFTPSNPAPYLDNNKTATQNFNTVFSVGFLTAKMCKTCKNEFCKLETALEETYIQIRNLLPDYFILAINNSRIKKNPFISF